MRMALCVLLVVAAAATAAAGVRADDERPIYVECFAGDGTAWYVPDTFIELFEPFGCTPEMLPGPLAPPQAAPPPESPPEIIGASGGVDVGFDADPNIAPDPSLYATEVLCPDGSIWAVAIGDPFVCPAGS